MCVIIYKPAGVAMPTKEEFKAANLCNPDGCGFISSKGLNYKGLNLDGFLKAISKVGQDEECIIHFRLATHGRIMKSNCHPFECGGVWFAHNGILRIEPRDGMTDSETAFRDILIPAIKFYGMGSDQVKNTVRSIIGWSKFAFMENGEVTLFGDFEKKNGLYYSNTRHFAYMRASTKPRSSISWEEYLAMRYR